MNPEARNPEAQAGADIPGDETLNDDQLEQVNGGLDKIGVGHPNL